MSTRNRLMRWVSMAPSEDVTIKIHSEYQVTFRAVPGGSHLCRQPPASQAPQVSPLPPWAPNYEAKPTQYDLSVIQNTYDFYIDNYIAWKAAQQEQIQQRTQNMEKVMRKYMREIRKRDNPTEESSSDDEDDTDEIDAAIFNHYLSTPYEVISIDRVPLDLIPEDFQGDLEQGEEHGSYIIHVPSDMETGENFREIGADNISSSMVDGEGRSVEDRYSSHDVEAQRSPSPEINVCDTDDEDELVFN